MRRPLVVLACLLVVGVGLPARAQTGGDVDDICTQAGGGFRECEGARHIIEIAGRLCRNAGGGGLCSLVDGRTITPPLVDAHEQSWLEHALALQRGIDIDKPLQEELWLQTHNAFNEESRLPTAPAAIDPNQIYSITDQLRMGVRSIELDVYWLAPAVGIPIDGLNDAVVCHAQGIDFTAFVYHLGCGVNRPLPDVLGEIRRWMNAHPDEMLLVYLENSMDNMRAGHDHATADLRAVFGDLIYETPKGCAHLPMDTTRAAIKATGARIMFTGNCGAGGAWGDVVFERGPRWDEDGSDYGDDYSCAAERKTSKYDRDLIRRFHNNDGLDLLLDLGGEITPNESFAMARCGVNMIGLDHVVPFDPRLVAMVWSWAPDEPRAGGCAAKGTDGRFYGRDCAQSRPYTCVVSHEWKVTGPPGPWNQGAQRCAAIGGRFRVPTNGWTNQALHRVNHGSAWLNYSQTSDGWVANSLVS